MFESTANIIEYRQRLCPEQNHMTVTGDSLRDLLIKTVSSEIFVDSSHRTTLESPLQRCLASLPAPQGSLFEPNLGRIPPSFA